MRARFEVVRTDDSGHHARFVVANGQTVWVTESYTRKRAAERAIAALCKTVGMYGRHTEVRHIDERTCTCGTDATALTPGEVVVHRRDGKPCYIALDERTKP